MVELVRGGRNPEGLAQKFDPSAQAIRNWVRQADRDDGRRSDGFTTDERQELTRLRRENRALREEREILRKPRPGSLGDRFDPVESFAFASAHRAAHRITTRCRTLGGSVSG